MNIREKLLAIAARIGIWTRGSRPASVVGGVPPTEAEVRIAIEGHYGLAPQGSLRSAIDRAIATLPGGDELLQQIADERAVILARDAAANAAIGPQNYRETAALCAAEYAASNRSYTMDRLDEIRAAMVAHVESAFVN